MNELTIWEKQQVDFGTDTKIYVDDPELAAASNNIGGNFILSDGPLTHYENEEIIEIEIAEGVDEIDKTDYAVAAACGVISAALDIFWLGRINIQDAAAISSEQLGKFVVKAARLVGYHGNNVNDALQKIISVCNPSGRNTSSGFTDLSRNASAAGLCFSILSQFTGKTYGTDENGHFSMRDIPENDLPAGSTPAKLLNGILIWALGAGSTLAADPQGMISKGIPRSVSDLIKDLSESPIFSVNRSKGHAKAENTVPASDIYALAADIIGGGFGLTASGHTFDISQELKGQLDPVRFSLSILLNECMVRGFYMIRRLLMEIKNKNVRSVSDLSRIEAINFLPYSNRSITRMLTVSSATFVAVTTAKAAVVAARSSAGGWKGSVIDFVTHINYGGMISFVMACKADGEYVISDARKAYTEMLAWKKLLKQEEHDMFSSFARLRLDSELTRLLDCLKRHKLLYDIRAAKSLKEIEKKQSWLLAWEDDTARARGISEEEYFIDDEDSIYDVINARIDAEREQQTEEFLWLYIMAVDLKLFSPYTGLDTAENAGALILRNNYETEIFCTRQDIVKASDLDEMTAMIDSYVGVLSSSEGQKNAGIAAAAILTGGVALVPLAIAKGRGMDVDEAARKAMASVNTSVIKSTSQVAGMFGAAGSGLFEAGLSVQYDCARILMICEYVLKGKNNDLEAIENINRYFYEQIVQIEGRIYSASLEKSGKSESRKRLSRLENTLRYFIKCRDILTEMCENW